MPGAHRRPWRWALLGIGVCAFASVGTAGEAEEIAALRAIEARIETVGWPQARRDLAAFDQANPSLGPESRDERRCLDGLLAAARAPYFRAFVGRRLEPIVRERIRRRLAARDSTHAREVKWIQRSAATEVVAALRQEVRAQDPAAADAEIEAFWAQRPGRTGEPRGIPWPRDRWGEDRRSWRATPLEVRVTYLFGRFLRASPLYEVTGAPEAAPCPRCEGEGTISFTLSNGGSVTVLCPRCGGRGGPTRLRYR